MILRGHTELISDNERIAASYRPVEQSRPRTAKDILTGLAITAPLWLLVLALLAWG